MKVRSFLCWLLLWPGLSWALDAFEIQVYNAEVNDPGQYSVEIHLNNVLSGRKDPEYVGAVASHHLTHLTLEFARGMTPYWELGAYFQTAYSPDNEIKYAGGKLRSKFVVPRAQSGAFHLGLNVEISNIPYEFEADRWGAELRPIVGYEWQRVTVLCNPIFDLTAIHKSVSTPVANPSLKAFYNTRQGYGVGLEYYADFGALNAVTPFTASEQYIFAAVDLLDSWLELNVALGQGLNTDSDRYIAKVITGFDF